MTPTSESAEWNLRGFLHLRLLHLWPDRTVERQNWPWLPRKFNVNNSARTQGAACAFGKKGEFSKNPVTSIWRWSWALSSSSRSSCSKQAAHRERSKAYSLIAWKLLNIHTRPLAELPPNPWYFLCFQMFNHFTEIRHCAWVPSQFSKKICLLKASRLVSVLIGNI